MADLQYDILTKFDPKAGADAIKQQEQLRAAINITNETEAKALEKAVELLRKKITLQEALVESQEKQRKQLNSYNLTPAEQKAYGGLSAISSPTEDEQKEIQRLKTLQDMYSSLGAKLQAYKQVRDSGGDNKDLDAQISKQKELERVLLDGAEKQRQAREKDAADLENYNKRVIAEQQKILDAALKQHPGRTVEEAADGSQKYAEKVKALNTAEAELAKTEQERNEIVSKGTAESIKAAQAGEAAAKRVKDAGETRSYLQGQNATNPSAGSLLAEANATRESKAAIAELNKTTAVQIAAEEQRTAQVVALLEREKALKKDISKSQDDVAKLSVPQVDEVAKSVPKGLVFQELRASFIGIRAAASGSAYGISRVGSSLLTMLKHGAAAGAGLLALGVVVVASTLKFIAYQKALTDLNIELARNGKFSFDASEQYQKVADSMEQASGVAKSKWLPALAELSKLNVDGNNIQRYGDAIKNLTLSDPSLDPKKAGEIIAKSITGNFDELENLGIYIDDTKSHAEKLDLAFQQLADNGLAAATLKSETLAGQFENAKTTVGSFFESIGRGIFTTASSIEALRNLEGTTGLLAAREEEAKASNDELAASAGSLSKAYLEAGEQIQKTGKTITETYQIEAKNVSESLDIEITKINAVIAADKGRLQARYETLQKEIDLDRTLSPAGKESAKAALQRDFETGSANLNIQGAQAEIDKIKKETAEAEKSLNDAKRRQTEAQAKARPAFTADAAKLFPNLTPETVTPENTKDLEAKNAENAKQLRELRGEQEAIKFTRANSEYQTYSKRDQDRDTEIENKIADLQKKLEIGQALAKVVGASSDKGGLAALNELVEGQVRKIAVMAANNFPKQTAAEATIYESEQKKKAAADDKIAKDREVEFKRRQEKAESDTQDRQLNINALEGNAGAKNPRFNADQVLRLETEVANLKRQNEIQKGTVADPSKTDAQNKKAAELAISNANLNFQNTIRSITEKAGSEQSQDFKNRAGLVRQSQPNLTDAEVTYKVHEQLAAEMYRRGGDRLDLNKIVPGYKGYQAYEPSPSSGIGKTNDEKVDDLKKQLEAAKIAQSAFKQDPRRPEGQNGYGQTIEFYRTLQQTLERSIASQTKENAELQKSQAQTVKPIEDMSKDIGALKHSALDGHSLSVHDHTIEAILKGKTDAGGESGGLGLTKTWDHVPPHIGTTPSKAPPPGGATAPQPITVTPQPHWQQPGDRPGALTPEEIERRGGLTVAQQEAKKRIDAAHKAKTDADTADALEAQKPKDDANKALGAINDAQALEEWNKKHDAAVKAQDDAVALTNDPEQNELFKQRSQERMDRYKDDYSQDQLRRGGHQEDAVDKSQASEEAALAKEAVERMGSQKNGQLGGIHKALEAKHGIEVQLMESIITELTEQKNTLAQFKTRIQGSNL